MVNSAKIAKQIEALEDAIASGAQKVKYADREVSYRTMAEMYQALELLQKKLSGSKGIKIIDSSYCSGLK